MTTEPDRQCARNILAGFVRTEPPADFMLEQVANHIAHHRRASCTMTSKIRSFFTRDKRKRIKIGWTCSDYVRHEHRWYWTAWLCGKWQDLSNAHWWHCAECGRNVRLHVSDQHSGCAGEDCPNLFDPLVKGKSDDLPVI